MPFSATRPKSTLLIPSKQPLSPPTRSQSRSTTTPTLQIRSSEDNTNNKAQAQSNEIRRIEVDFAVAPQPFLDPGLWEKLESKSTGEGAGM
ncbi:hypothetical protein BJY00DRAFT_285068 [Aspergillus carlsbadensis]|nr:hypothetical protein BJY00DRAFT_285068 [Aspergillus carlsbadensis]